MTYSDRQRRNIVIFAIVATISAMLISGTAVIAVLSMHHAHRSASVWVR